MISPYVIPGIKFIEKLSIRPVEEDDIVDAVCEYFNVSFYDIRKKCRKREFVYPRQVAMYLMYRVAKIPLKLIGEKFRYNHPTNSIRRDHTTVIHSRDTIRNLMQVDDKVRSDIEVLTVIVKSKTKLAKAS